MVSEGVIERAASRFCNPLRIVKKDDGSVRVCLDARHSNNVIEDDHEAPPIINEILQRYSGKKYFSKLDLTHGYWQVPLHVNSRPYTAFLFDSHMYQFRRIPFGLKTAGSGFIRSLSFALKRDFDKNISCYIDDILIGTETVDEHMNILDRLFRRLLEYNFTLKISKCEFFRESIPFLGFITSAQGVIPEPNKLQIITNFAAPQNKRQLQQFLGVCNYYRQFNLNQSQSVSPLRKLLQKNKDWQWTKVHARAFEQLKQDFRNYITLKHVLPGRPYKVQTDASDRGVSGILYQISHAGDHNVIGIVSRCLTRCESNYTTTEKELLAIIYSLTKFRVYLIGTRFEIITDHQSLTFKQHRLKIPELLDGAFCSNNILSPFHIAAE